MIDAYQSVCQSRVDNALDALFDAPRPELQRLYQAMRYSVINGGKRVRPVLVYAACEALGGNASRVFTLVYGLYHPDMLYRRYPGVEGSAYLVAGLGVNYQRADGIVLAPIRTGVGLRLGANVGTMSYSRQRNLLPF